ncbi:TRAF3-interacting protein 1-like isoform X1 [Acipenser ruthenus]|uniref:TRAF3-interacting protein 1-like isoform X1 n=1 Tax=Acipenser ruthenus TaxID=7906 RepID=UPI00145A43E9|nr:TRAF3-interacting protein 1-like isoform X1 [Acipenser ruthenus]
MNGSIAKKTQETLGKVIKKPPLTEKLLSKPPFRFLHDIFTEVIRTTGFMKGLYSELEMKSENVKDKEAKIAFLQKAIDVVIMVTSEPLSVKPGRIVSGHEPEKTNELLQAMGKCCLNKLSSEDAVQRVLAGEKLDLKGKHPSTSKSQDKENREGKEEDKKRHKDKEEIRDTEIKDRSTSRDRKVEQPKYTEAKKTEKDRHKDDEKQEKGRDRERTKERDREKEKSRDRDKEKGREKEKDREKGKERDRDREKRRERPKEPEEKAKEPEEKAERKSKGTEETRHRKASQLTRKNSKTENDKEPAEVLEAEPAEVPEAEPAEIHEAEHESPARIPRPSSAKGQRRRPKPGGQGSQSSKTDIATFSGNVEIAERLDESYSDGEAEILSSDKSMPLENGEAVDAMPTHSKIPRPSSARPAPPRVKRQDSADVPSVERIGSGKPLTAVIVDGKKDSDDEDNDELFVVEEAAPLLPDLPKMEMEPAVELKEDEKHGGLVKKILETKKDYEASQPSSKSKDQDTTIVSEATKRKERDLVSREIEKLRSSIQTVCRSALPLGKIMDYIQEDMDSMKKELQMWRSENAEHAAALIKEQRITDNAVEPLKAELVELEQLIKDQQDKICAAKANILRNEEKIEKMVSSINFSSRT